MVTHNRKTATTARRRCLLSSSLSTAAVVAVALACAADQPAAVHGFVTPPLPTVSTRTANTFASQQQYTTQLPYRQQQQRPLFVVADPPNREEKTKKRGEDDDDDHNDSWVATSSGGFLPKIPQFLKDKLGGRHQSPSSSSTEAAAADMATAAPATTKPAPSKAKPIEVVTIQEYKAAVAEERDQMVCVRFYAPWCKACKAVQQPFRKLCRDYSGMNVKFVEVPLNKENAFLHEGLGVPSLPYGHIYHPTAGLVEERKINLKKKEFATFEHVLKTYVDGECAVDYPEGGLASPLLVSM